MRPTTSSDELDAGSVLGSARNWFRQFRLGSGTGSARPKITKRSGTAVSVSFLVVYYYGHCFFLFVFVHLATLRRGLGKLFFVFGRDAL
jgi:hypothetical protein